MPPGPVQPHVLVLWDIDHTLIETRGVGRAIYERAFLAATGRPLESLANISGRTEQDIMTETLRINGIEPTLEAVTALSEALINGYGQARDELAATGRALPGAREVLATLHCDAAFHQTVLTGNLHAVARVKLEVFDLTQYLDLDSGAYGDDATERADLVGIARRRVVERAGVDFTQDKVVLVGDTPNDVAAGLAAGLHVIGVATGKTGARKLREAGAHGVIARLSAAIPTIVRLTGISPVENHS